MSLDVGRRAGHCCDSTTARTWQSAFRRYSPGSKSLTEPDGLNNVNKDKKDRDHTNG